MACMIPYGMMNDETLWRLLCNKEPERVDSNVLWDILKKCGLSHFQEHFDVYGVERTRDILICDETDFPSMGLTLDEGYRLKRYVRNMYEHNQ